MVTSRLPAILSLLALWGAVALLKSAIEVADGGSWSRALAIHLPVAMVWVVLTPFVDRLSQYVAARRWGYIRGALAHAPLLVAAALLDATCTRTLVVVVGGALRTPFHVTLVYYADVMLAYYLVAVMATNAFRVHRSIVARSNHELTLRARLTRARLQHLEQQLQPHFLFNALGAVMELAHEAPRDAAEMLRNLSSLLRYALEGAPGGDVTVEEELNALEPYLQVQRVRFADWLTLETVIDPAVRSALVPRLALQPLVENAIRHGLSRRLEPGRLSIEAVARGPNVVLRVRDNGVGLMNGATPSGHGIGLAVLRERLRETHGEAAALRLTDAPGGGVITEVELPCRFAAPTSETQNEHEDDAAIEPHRTLPSSRFQAVIAIAGGWALFGAFWVQQSWAYARIRTPGRAVPILDVLWRDLPIVACWALLTPLVFLGTRALLRASWPRWFVVLMHLAAAPSFAAAHLAGLSFLRHGVPWIDWSGGLFTIDLLVYLVLVVLAQRRGLESALVERATTVAHLEAAVVEAGLAATAQRVGSHVVLRALDALAEIALRDAAAAERGLARLAELVRATLEMVGASAVRLDRELEALEAYLSMRQIALSEPVSLAVSCEPGIGSPLIRPGLLRALAEDLLEAGPNGTITLMRRDDTLIVVGTLEEGRRDERPPVATSARTFAGPGVIVTESRDGVVIIVSHTTVQPAPMPTSARISSERSLPSLVA